MRLLLGVAALVMLAAAPAAAQSTSCGWELGRWVCRDNPGVQFNFTNPNTSFQQGYDSMDRLAQDFAARRAAEAAAAQAATPPPPPPSALDTLDAMIANGNCAYARTTALNSGRPNLVVYVDQACPAAPAP